MIILTASTIDMRAVILNTKEGRLNDLNDLSNIAFFDFFGQLNFDLFFFNTTTHKNMCLIDKTITDSFMIASWQGNFINIIQFHSSIVMKFFKIYKRNYGKIEVNIRGGIQ